MLAHERQELLVLARVPHVARVGLHSGHADYAPFCLQRNSQPRLFFGREPREHDLALLDQLERALVRQELRLSRAEHIRGRPPGLTLAERIPPARVRDVDVDLVDVVGEADQLPLVVIERDEEVVREHELAHDGVHLAVELLHVPRRARELGDPVKGCLNALGAPLAGRGRHVRAFLSRSTDPSIVRDESAVQQPRLDGTDGQRRASLNTFCG